MSTSATHGGHNDRNLKIKTSDRLRRAIAATIPRANTERMRHTKSRQSPGSCRLTGVVGEREGDPPSLLQPQVHWRASTAAVRPYADWIRSVPAGTTPKQTVDFVKLSYVIIAVISLHMLTLTSIYAMLLHFLMQEACFLWEFNAKLSTILSKWPS